MIKTDKVIIVEGKHDKIKLSSVIEGTIIETDGFRIFKDKEKVEMIKRLSGKNGIIILTDSDAAGFKIRGYLNGIIDNDRVQNLYIPDVFGKEKRKSEPSKEGKLGVEGLPKETLEKLFKGVSVGDVKNEITILDLYKLGLSGNKDSANKRRKVLRELGLPERLSGKRMCEILGSLYKKEEFFKEVERILNAEMA